ncbi:N-acetyltransferase [Dulcicalothrix desertica PCC 7102]|uniref:N-acetyltransferase n=1 Tax=Dulcicalothrix desertica PCC 7102 TaxID=232991 RepID=A0A433VKZ7_9CYAN|nr:N-acetyltransferase [Dulcicalothrix desertica]RUT06751.1 N-acetyltransferase [Dulcicalothrix desertica PCC 7102]TWH50141.1 putative acetyltransferase [Dulcicalothrix desertica PCC 7102]
MSIRCEASPDYSKIAEVITSAFGQPNEAKLVEAIRNSENYIPELSLVAEIDGNIVAHLLFSYIHIISNEILPVLALAPVAVLPQFQNQGIGTALVQYGLDRADELGEALIIVLGHPSFYSRFGFVQSTYYGIKSPFEVRAEAFMVKPLKNYEIKYTGEVIYPQLFNDV